MWKTFLLSKGTIFSVKKSQMVNIESQISEFINRMTFKNNVAFPDCFDDVILGVFFYLPHSNMV